MGDSEVKYGIHSHDSVSYIHFSPGISHMAMVAATVSAFECVQTE